MNFRELEYQSSRRDYLALESLDRRLEQADQHLSVREEVLTELDFLPELGKLPWTKLWNKWSRRVEHFIQSIPALSILVASILLDGIFWIFAKAFDPLWENIKLQSFIYPLLAAIIAYQNWRKTRLNSTVDDSLKRKDVANAMIMNNPELLLPYVQTAMHATAETQQFEHDQFWDAKIDMYIYCEIDNLEFVFDKSNHNLIDELFVMRAIKIFIARCENRLFRLKAKELLEKGRYNHDFKISAERLSLVAEWRQVRSSQPKQRLPC